MLDRIKIDGSMHTLFERLSQLQGCGIEPGHVSETLAPLGDIPPFLRALLVADGTVTMALEAYFEEAINIRTIRQGRLDTPTSLPALGVNIGRSVLFREVELVGGTTGVCYVHACSVINESAINVSVFEQLVDEHEGIGVVLRNVAKGSFREVLDVSRLAVMANGDLSRTYRVSMSSIPAILITEEFPMQVYTAR